MSKTVFHVAFPISDPVKDQAYGVIETIRQAERPRDHVNALTDVIIAMTEEGLEYLFLDSLKFAKVGKFHIQAVQMGVNGARKGLELVGRRALKSMSDEQLLGIANYMEGLVVAVEEE